MDAKNINELLGITEAYRMPDTLLPILLDDSRRMDLFERFMAIGEDLTGDWFRDYYQQEHGDRDKLKQDFTPDCVAELAMTLLNPSADAVIGDICAGTGTLALEAYRRGLRKFRLIEISARTVPVLLFNLAVRNVEATVWQADALTRKTAAVYEVIPGERFSDIRQAETSAPDFQADAIISNPPYSLKWEWTKEDETDTRFLEYGLPPKSKADFAFVLDGLARLPEGGRMVTILPHGVLFRDSREKEIRTKLLEANLIDSVVGLPENLFLNTGIPVCLLIIERGRTSHDVFIVDASGLYEKRGKVNVMEPGHLTTVEQAFQLRRGVERLAKAVTLEDIRSNDFNLNIPRYVDTSVPKPPVDIIAELTELNEIHDEMRSTAQFIMSQLEELTIETDPKKMQAIRDLWRKYCGML